MGKVLSVVTSQFRNYNIEQRAHNAISQTKLRPVPKYESTKKDLERILLGNEIFNKNIGNKIRFIFFLENPEIVEETQRKNPELDNRLKQVFVTSSHNIDQKRNLNPERPLPLETTPVEFFELGFRELEVSQITPGKCSLRQIIQFIGDHKLNPEEWTAEKIASDYKMKVEDVKNLLEFYRIFELHVPEKGKKKQQVLLRTNYNTQNFKEFVKLLTPSKAIKEGGVKSEKETNEKL